MDKPLISVVVPVYNVERYMACGLDCLLRQTYETIEVLLIDDGSTDGSGLLCDRYAALDPRVRVVHLPENRGVSHARNEGMRQAAGAYLSFFDPDDEAEDRMLERLLQSLEENGAEISMCGMKRVGFGPYVTQMKEVPGYAASGMEAFGAILRHEAAAGVVAKLYRRDVLEGCAFDEDACFGEDILLLCRLLQRAAVVSYIPDRLYSYIRREDSATQSRFTEKQYTYLKVFDLLYQEAAEKFPQYLPQLRLDIVEINVRFAVSAVESEHIRGRQLRAYLKRFRRNLHRSMDWGVLRGFTYRKIAAEAVLLYASAQVFWAVTVVYKWVKRRLA